MPDDSTRKQTFRNGSRKAALIFSVGAVFFLARPIVAPIRETSAIEFGRLCELPLRWQRARATFAHAPVMVAAGFHKGVKIMTIRTDNPSTIDKPQGAAGEGNPTLLTAAELDHVAAAGRKPGLTGGTGAGALPQDQN